jgi:hypothetical protein
MAWCLIKHRTTIIGVTESETTKWAGHAALMKEMRMNTEFLSEKYEGKRLFRIFRSD